MGLRQEIEAWRAKMKGIYIEQTLAHDEWRGPLGRLARSDRLDGVVYGTLEWVAERLFLGMSANEIIMRERAKSLGGKRGRKLFR